MVRYKEYLFSSAEVKTPVSFSKCILFAVLLSVNFSHFYLPIQNHKVNSTKLDTKHLWVKRIQVYSNKGSHPFPSGNNNLQQNKNTLANFKHFFRTTWLISTKLGTKHSWDPQVKVKKKMMGFFLSLIIVMV